MADIKVRQATSKDLPALIALDHGYSTEYVWQITVREEDGQTLATFRPVHLPRPVRVAFPREAQLLKEAWNRRVCFLVAEEEDQLKGYLNLTLTTLPGVAWLADAGVERRFRRNGVGSVLLTAAIQWARENGFYRLVLETQSKNYPAICFAQKHGLAFCGYNDRYYPNQDVALFFGLILR